VGLPVVVLDGLGDSIEVPLLCSSIVSPSLQPDVVSTVALSNSVEWKLGHKVEWSVDMESKVFADTLGLDCLCFVKIDYIPDLSLGFIVAPYLYWVAFLVFSSSDIKDLVIGPVDELVILILEDLEPAGVCAPDLHVVGSSRVLDIPRLIVVSCSNSQRLLMEVPHLGSSTILSLDDHIPVVDEIKVSVVWQ